MAYLESNTATEAKERKLWILTLDFLPNKVTRTVTVPK
jgi:hypothetical protein